MRAPRWLRRARRTHPCEQVDLVVTVAGQVVLRASLEEIALSTKYGRGLDERWATPTGLQTYDGYHVSVSTRMRR